MSLEIELRRSNLFTSVVSGMNFLKGAKIGAERAERSAKTVFSFLEYSFISRQTSPSALRALSLESHDAPELSLRGWRD